MFVAVKDVNKVFARRCLEMMERFQNRGEEEDGDIMEEDEMADQNTLEYVLRHGVAHLLDAGKRKDARRIVLNVKWLLARGGDGLGVMEDCKRFGGSDRTMRVLGQAISLSMSDLRKDPRRVVGQLVGRLMAVAGVGGDGKEDEGKEVPRDSVFCGV